MIIYLGIGSNIDALKNIRSVKKQLEMTFKNIRYSSVYESQAVGFDGNDFLNFVVEIDSDIELEILIEYVKKIEEKLGRKANATKYSSRSIDIDILLYSDRVCSSPIVLPRTETSVNAFVLWPLSELAFDRVEPGGALTYGELWLQFDKSLQKIERLDQ